MAEQAEESLDLDAEMHATLAAMNESEIAPTTPEAIEPIESAESAEAKAERLRDEKGRFAPKAEEPTETSAAEPAPEEVVEVTPIAEVPVPAAEPAQPSTVEAKRPPSTWSAQAKADFAALPPHIQSEVIKRESDFGKGIAQYRERAEYGDRIKALVTPYEPIIRASGATPEQAVQHMLNSEYILRTGTPRERGEVLMRAAQQYGADLSPWMQQQPQPGQEAAPQPALDPAVARELEESRKFRESWAQQQRLSEQDRQQAEQRQQQALQDQIQAFQNEPDEKGMAKHLYFTDVMDQMIALIPQARVANPQAAPRDVLEQAYDMACWARPDIRSALLARQQAEVEAQRQEASRKKAAEAKRIQGTNLSTKGAPPSGNTPPLGSEDDTMREVMAAIKARESA